jgi:hypothetical protein
LNEAEGIRDTFLLAKFDTSAPFVKMDFIQVNQNGSQSQESPVCFRGKDEVERVGDRAKE